MEQLGYILLYLLIGGGGLLFLYFILDIIKEFRRRRVVEIVNIDWEYELSQDNPDREKLVEAALDWDTCPCGQLVGIPRHSEISVPLDRGLANLGSWFGFYVNLSNWEEARETRQKILDRAEELGFPPGTSPTPYPGPEIV